MKKMKWLVVVLIVVLALAMFLTACAKKDEPADEQRPAEVPGQTTDGETDPGQTDPGQTDPAGPSDPVIPQPTEEQIKTAQKQAISGKISNFLDDEDSSVGSFVKDQLSETDLGVEATIALLSDSLVESGFTTETFSNLLDDLQSIIDLFEDNPGVEDIEWSEEEEEIVIDQDVIDVILAFLEGHSADELPVDELPVDVDVDELIEKLDGVDFSDALNKAVSAVIVEFVKTYVDVLAQEESIAVICDGLSQFIEDLPVEPITNMIGIRYTRDVVLENGTAFPYTDEDLFALFGADAELIASLYDLDNSKAQIIAQSDACQTVVSELLGAFQAILSEEDGNRAEFKAIFESIAASLEELLTEPEEADMAPGDVEEEEEEEDGILSAFIINAFENADYTIINNFGAILSNFAVQLGESGEFEPALTDLVNMARGASEEELSDLSDVLVGIKFFGAILATLDCDTVLPIVEDVVDLIPSLQETIENFFPGMNQEEITDEEPEEEEEEQNQSNPFEVLQTLIFKAEPVIEDIVVIVKPAYDYMSADDQAALEALFIRLANNVELLNLPADETAPLAKLLNDVMEIAAKPTYEEAKEALENPEEEPEANSYKSQGEIIGCIFSYVNFSAMPGMGGSSQETYEEEPIVGSNGYVLLPMNATDEQIINALNKYAYLDLSLDNAEDVDVDTSEAGFTTISYNGDGVADITINAYVVDPDDVIISYYDNDVQAVCLPKPLEGEDDYDFYQYIQFNHAAFVVYDRATMVEVADSTIIGLSTDVTGVDVDQEKGFYGAYFVVEDDALGSVYIPFVYYLFDPADMEITNTYFEVYSNQDIGSPLSGSLVFEYEFGATSTSVCFQVEDGEVIVEENDFDVTAEDITVEGEYDMTVEGEYEVTFTYGEISKTVKFTVYDNGYNNEDYTFCLIIVDAEYQATPYEQNPDDIQIKITPNSTKEEILEAIYRSVRVEKNLSIEDDVFFGLIGDGYSSVYEEALDVVVNDDEGDICTIEVSYQDNSGTSTVILYANLLLGD